MVAGFCGTTAVFLEYFGLRSLEDLPAADELRRLPIQKPEALVTADPGLATVPPEDLGTPGEASPVPDPQPGVPSESKGPEGAS